MALGGKGVSSGRGASLIGSDTGLSSSIGGLQGIDVEDGIHLNFGSNVYYTKAAGSPAVFAALTSLLTFTGGNQSMFMGASGRLMQSVTNIPRIEYGANGTRLGLLMEASRTNLALNSRDLSAGTWTKSNLQGGTATSATSIDGTDRNIRIVDDTANGVHGVIAGITVTANTTYCMSAIAKAAGRNFAFMYGINTDQFGAMFDLVNVTSTQFVAGTSTVNQHGIIPLGNGYFLIWVSGILNAASTTLNFVGGPATSTSAPSGYSYAGNGTSGIDMQYIQIELGAFPSSRISTAGSGVARTADSCIRTLGSEFSATAGTVVVGGRASGGVDGAANQLPWDFNDTGTTNRFGLFRNSGTNTAEFRMTSGGVAQLGTLTGTFVDATAFKAAAAYATNDAALSFNGGAVLTDNSVTLPSVNPTVLGLGGNIALSTMNGHILTFDYLPQRVNDTVLKGI